MLELRIKEDGSSTTVNGVTRYSLELSLECISGGSYALQDYRVRGFFNHHYVLTVLDNSGYYAINDIQPFQGVGGTMTEGYDDWMNNIRPPRIDENKFSSEILLYMPTRTLSSSATLANQGRFNLRGMWDNTERLGRYNDCEDSYSYIGLNGENITNPMNWVFEHRDNSKTETISNITSLGNTVTVTTSAAHSYNSGDAVRITDISSGVRSFGSSGERYEGTFKITVTGPTTFTYHTKHVVTASTHTSGTVEFWEVVVNEQSISSISGDGSGTITINTTRSHDLQVNDIIAIEGTTNYDGNQLIITSRLSTNSVECKLTGNTSTTLELVGSIKYSSRPPSAAIAVNYVSGYEAKILEDHTLFTYLRYADKDTYIDNNVANDFGSSTQLKVRNFSTNSPPNYQRMVFRFPIAGIPLSQLLFAEINAVYESGTDGDAQMGLFQMVDDSWSDSDTWDTINPLIDMGDPIGYYNFINVGSGENDAYTKFTVSTDKLTKWLDGIEVPDVGFVKTQESNSIENVYWSTETIEYKPYIVISSGVVDDEEPPTVQLTNTNNALIVDSAIGDGFGEVTITSTTSSNLNVGDLVNIISPNYNVRSAVVLTTPTAFTYTINIPGNTSTVTDVGGISLRQTVVDVSALGIDDSEISDDSLDIEIRKTSSLTNVTPSNIVKSPSTNLSFDFTLSGIGDGYYDIAVKDEIGNQSARLTAPILMYYRKHSTEQVSAVVRSGDIVDIIGFNVEDPLTLNIADDTLIGGTVSGGLTQSIGLVDIDAPNNLFTFTLPSGIQGKYNVLSVDDVADTILVENCSFKIGDIVSFNSLGNHTNAPIVIGDLYYIVAATQIGFNVEIQISYSTGGSAIDLDHTDDMNMKMYNYVSPAYVIKDGIITSDYNNQVSIIVDDYAPMIEIPTIVGTGDIINVTITDISPINQSSVSFINGTGSLSNSTDPRILIYEVNVTGTGILRVDVADEVGNLAFATEPIPTTNTLAISVDGYTIIDADHFILNMHVTFNPLDPVSAIIASNSSSPGIFAEGEVSDTSYGVISNLVASVDEMTFDIEVDGLVNGVLTVYANTEGNDTTSIIPPVLTSVTPECFNNDSVLTLTGINLNHDETSSRSFLNSNLNITNATMTSVTVYYGFGTPDGEMDFVMSMVHNNVTLFTNTITNILDNTPPIISINGDQVMEVIQGESYIEEGAIAIDNIFGDVTADILIQGAVDSNTLGTYLILYTVSDPCGNENAAIRTINVVTGCPVYIEVNPTQGYVGDTVTVSATVGLLNPIPINNVVTFNGIVGTVIGGDRNAIQVVVPFGATTGPVQVETGPTNTGYENCSLSNIDIYTLLFDDEEFDPERDKLTRDYQKRKTLTTGSGLISPFGRDSDITAIYNRDMGYSGFSEVTDENSMVQNVYSIILTRAGERIFNPDFGTRIEDYIHSIVDDIDGFQKRALTEIIESVKRYEPRVSIVEEDSYVFFNDAINDVMIVLYLLVPTGNVRVIGITLKSISNGEANI
jgi:phage baseplate assembly protein W